MSLYSEFRDRYKLGVMGVVGCGHEMCSRARKIVLCRGSLPCDVLFIGEAPGLSEDVVGQPFVGPAGKLLDTIVQRSIVLENTQRVANGHPELTWAFTNLVCCIPRNADDPKKAGEPGDDQIGQCKDRLEEFIGIARPRLVVCVGKHAREWLENGIKGNVVYDAHAPRNVRKVEIDHPAFILRSPLGNRGLMVQRCVVTVGTAVEELP